MNELLLERASGSLGQNALARRQYTQLLHSFRPSPRLTFDGGDKGTALAETPGAAGSGPLHSWAHLAGVNALALERFDGRILISGGSDATIRIWDLESSRTTASGQTFCPVAQIARQNTSPSSSSFSSSAASSSPSSPGGHRFGVTHLSFYPFDAAAFLSSSYDQTLKLWTTDAARLSGSFDLGSKVYTHAVSPIASHLLVACATQHPAVRLVDLRSGAAVQSLVAPGRVAGAVLSAAWSPRHEHTLASGALDGSVCLWDVRRASSLVAQLDREPKTDDDPVSPVSLVSPDSRSHSHPRPRPLAHAGPVNGLAWTDDGAYLVSAGHDRRIRVWDAASGANTLVSFGPSVRNGGLASVAMVLSPSGLTPSHGELLFWPNETEIVVFGLHDGSVVTRLRGMGPSQFAVRLPARTQAQTRGQPVAVDRSSARKNRVTSLVWRGAGGAGSETGGVVMGGRAVMGAVYSGHSDGQIRAWMPQPATEPDEALEDTDDGSAHPEAAEERDRKRRALDQAYRSLMGTPITFR